MTTAVFRFRFAEPRDYPRLQEVINKAYAVENFFKTCDRIDQPEIEANVRKGKFLVMEDGSDIAACIYYKLNAPKAYYGLLSVHPDAQGKGLARELVMQVEKIAQEDGCEFVEIEVVNLRTELPPFYEKLGYSLYGTAPFKDMARSKLPCHFLIMRKKL